MHVDHHPLITEFPELRNRILDLRSHDAQFAQLAKDYEAVDREIVRLEDTEVFDDVELEDLKKKRLRLKDHLYKMLVKSP